MKSKRSSRFLKLDYTTAIVVGAVSLLLFSISVIAVNRIISYQRTENDHKRPLEVTNLSYCSGEKLDLTVPQSSKPVPLVLYIHGGGWQFGSKVGGSFSLTAPLVKNDIAVASINYRLSGSAKFPAQIQDVFCAVRYLRKNAKQYNINPEKIGVIGISAGANLAILAATSADQPQLTSGSYSEQKSAVQASVGINGIYNLNTEKLKKQTNKNVLKFTGNDSFLKKQASPFEHISTDDPAQLLIYSPSDKQVFPSQTLDYFQKASTIGVNAQLLKVDNATHNLDPYFRFSTSPGRDSIKNSIAEFFIKQFDD